MSKELTAEEFLKSEGYEGLSKLLFYQDDKTPDEKLADLMDRYANAKLLEALERLLNHETTLHDWAGYRGLIQKEIDTLKPK